VKRRFSRLVAGASLVGLASCAALSQKADTTQYFVLTPLPQRAQFRLETTMGIGPVTIPDHLEDRIVTRLSAEEIAISDSERWAEPLRDALSSTLRQELGALLGTDRIVAYPWQPSAAPNLAIAVELVHFERTTHGTVEVAARWTIGKGSAMGASPVFTRSAAIRRAFSGQDTRARGRGVERERGRVEPTDRGGCRPLADRICDIEMIAGGGAHLLVLVSRVA
jgi:uncharacterized lipoprotein YmbA